MVTGISVFIVIAAILGILFALYQFRKVRVIEVRPTGNSHNIQLLSEEELSEDSQNELIRISELIANGARQFLHAEYRYMAVFVVCFSVVVFCALALVHVEGMTKHERMIGGLFSAISFVVGCITSIASGYMGMAIAVFTNVRVAVEARHGFMRPFNVAFRGGAVMGFGLTGVALGVLFILIKLFRLQFTGTTDLYENIAGYGLGGSSIALFGRVGGGIYTKAADVGADLAGKLHQGIPEDDPQNPATIADNVGDNVGDVAGMGADLFGSFAEATCAALVVAATCVGVWDDSYTEAEKWNFLMYPLAISATGILVCILTSFVATHFKPVRDEASIETVLKAQLSISTVLATIALFGVSYMWLPDSFVIVAVDSTTMTVHYWQVWLCVMCGLWSGLLIGYVTEYNTSHSHSPVRRLARTCQTSTATNIIGGLALGYHSVIIPVFAIAITIFICFRYVQMLGIACGALGMLCTLAIGLTIDVYGPISDNAGGIAEMAGLGARVRARTDALDAAGNTTAAIGKGFAIGSACLVSLALFGAFVTRAGIHAVDIMRPVEFAFLMIGAMLPYWFSAMTISSVAVAADDMVKEVNRQFNQIAGLLDRSQSPDYERCIEISTRASLREMIAPGILVMGSPIIVGVLFGTNAVTGLLAGSIVSSVQMAISASNTGGAWDNAKKYVESGEHGGKGSPAHRAAVVGDTVGDPLKDTSGPALNILMKLACVECLVFANFFQGINNGRGLLKPE